MNPKTKDKILRKTSRTLKTRTETRDFVPCDYKCIKCIYIHEDAQRKWANKIYPNKMNRGK